MVMVLSAFVFKEKVTPQKLAALLIAFTGCVMTVGVIGGHGLPLFGVISGLGAAFFYSLYTIFSKMALLRDYHPLTATAYSYGLAGLILAPLCNWGETMRLIGENSLNVVGLLALGLLLTMLPSVSYLKGLEKLEPSRASIIAFVEPLTAAIAGIVVYSEMLSPAKVAGMGLIFLSLVILNIRKRQSQP
jgi:drug/metabolite transporter (DMT)-like permease